MCIVSFIGDSYRQKWPERWPLVPVPVVPTEPIDLDKVTREDFEALKKEIEELKKL